MRELVRLAEVRETQAKHEMARLLDERAGVYATSGDSARALGAQQQDQQAAAGAAAQAGEGDGPGVAAGDGTEAGGDRGGGEGSAAAPELVHTARSEAQPLEPEGPAHLAEEKAALIAAAKRRKQAAEKAFCKLSQICVAADQVRGGEPQACPVPSHA